MSADDLGLRQVDEKEELEQRDRDLMEWVEGLADHKFSEEGEWLDECRTGVILCKVLGSISSETAVSFNVKPKGVWNYRDNISSYLDKLKAIDVLMFEVEELVELSKPGNVKSSLHDLARVAFERYGIPLPGATKAGAEIDAEAEVAEEDVDKIAQEVMLTLSQQQLPMVDLDADEDDDASAPNKSMLISMSGGLNLNSPAKDLHLSMAGGLNFDAIADDPIDQAVEKALLARSRDPAYNSEEGIQVVRLKRGQYLLLPLKKVFFCRILSGHLMVRVGGGWESFEVWLSRNKGFSGAPPQTFGMRRPGSMRRMEVDKERKGSVAERDVLERKGSIKRKDSYVRNLSFQKRGSFRRSGSFQRSKSEVQDPVERSATMGARREESFDRTGSFQKKGTVTRSVSVDRTGSFHRRVERKVSGTNPKKPRKAEPPTYEEAVCIFLKGICTFNFQCLFLFYPSPRGWLRMRCTPAVYYVPSPVRPVICTEAD